MMWFVKEEFLWGPLSTKGVRPSPVLSLYPLQLRGMTEAGIFSFQLHPASGGNGYLMVSKAAVAIQDKTRNNFEVAGANARKEIHKEANSRLFV
ncbi:hypothetical protein TNCV_56411 [Trichonephila clavipes]|nr:hypothetical protein TNCV_56411 [Trichonephila clavipes]